MNYKIYDGIISKKKARLVVPNSISIEDIGGIKEAKLNRRTFRKMGTITHYANINNNGHAIICTVSKNSDCLISAHYNKVYKDHGDNHSKENKTDPALTDVPNNQQQIGNNGVKNGIEYIQEGLPFSDKDVFIDMKGHVGPQEETFLGKHINGILKEIGLKTVDMSHVAKIEDKLPLIMMSTLGDKVVEYEVTKREPRPNTLTSYVQQNNVMKHALIKLLGVQIAGMNDHLAGTIFEILVYCADEQSNIKVKNNLIYTLLDGLLPNEYSYQYTFSD